jgi:hypothetical protein
MYTGNHPFDDGWIIFCPERGRGTAGATKEKTTTRETRENARRNRLRYWTFT